MIIFELLGFQFLALLNMEREVYQCRIVAWDYLGLRDYATVGTLSEFKKTSQTIGKQQGGE